jgi:hypothetical protein
MNEMKISKFFLKISINLMDTRQVKNEYFWGVIATKSWRGRMGGQNGAAFKLRGLLQRIYNEILD